MIIQLGGGKQSGKDTVAAMIQYILNVHHPIRDRHTLATDWTKFINVSVAERNHWANDNSSNFTVKSYAHKIKVHVADMLNVPVEQMEDEEWRNTELGEEWRVYEFTHSDNSSSRTFKEAYDNFVKVGGTACKTWVHTPRTLMQYVGTEVGRQIHPNYWVNGLFIDYVQPTGFSYPVKLLKSRRPGNAGLAVAVEMAKTDGIVYVDPHDDSDCVGETFKVTMSEKFKGNVGTIDNGKAVPMKVIGEPKQWKGTYPNWIIKDCRFRNEHDYPKTMDNDPRIYPIAIFKDGNEYEYPTPFIGWEAFDKFQEETTHAPAHANQDTEIIGWCQRIVYPFNDQDAYKQLTIWVDRNDCVEANHESDNSIDKEYFDEILDNNSDLTHLYQGLIDILETHNIIHN